MTSITTFAYGLTVRAIPLVIAAQAWPALETTFHFLDLLFLRKRTGTFRSRPFISGRDCVGSIPVEVWEEIKRWLVIAEMEDAEERIGQDVLGTDECFNTACEWWSSGRRGSTRFIDAVQKCEYCDERSWEWTVEFCEGEHGYHKSLQDLVARFGLALPLDHFIRTTPEIYSDRECVALLAIPSQVHYKSKCQTTISAKPGGDMSTDEQTIVDVDLTLPVDADLRFLRFLRVIDLELVESSLSTLKSVGPNVAAKAQIKRLTDPSRSRAARQEELSGVLDLPAVGIKPKWKLYTTSIEVD